MDDRISAALPLSVAHGPVRGHATLDLADAEWANQWAWHLRRDGYAARTAPLSEGGVTILLHRALLGLEAGDTREIDHIDRDRLNNRRDNLRIVTQYEQKQNVSSHRGTSSRYRGVSWSKNSHQWVAYVKIGGRHGKFIGLGYYTDEEEAARVAKDARARLMSHATD